MQRVVDVGTLEQSVRQVEPDLCLGFALQRRGPQARQSLHDPADERGRRREHGESDDVVGPVDLEGAGRLGKEIVEGEKADECADEARSQAQGPDPEHRHQEHERGDGQVGVRGPGRARDRADGDDGRRHSDQRPFGQVHPVDTIARIAPPGPHSWLPQPGRAR